MVKGAKRIRVFLRPAPRESAVGKAAATKRGVGFEAALVGIDKQIDLAVLKIQATDLPTIPFGSYGELRPGQMVIAIGSPFGVHSAVTFGVISSIDRQLGSNRSAIYLQTDAALAPGSSGGALVDTGGKLVGINTLIMDGERLGFAIPCNVVRMFYEQIRQDGQVSQPDAGFEVQDLTPLLASGLKLSRESGVLVTDVRPASPADRAGVRPEDIILAVDGRATDRAVDFLNRVQQKHPGQPIALRVLRAKAVLTVTIPLLEKMRKRDSPVPKAEPERNLIAKSRRVRAGGKLRT